MDRPYMGQMESTRVIYKPLPMASPTHIALLVHFKGLLKFKATKPISMDPKVSIREIFRRLFTHHPIQPSEHPHR
jgi:hypothetical protein